MDYGIYTTQGKKVLLGNRATVNGRDAIAYVKNGRLQAPQLPHVRQKPAHRKTIPVRQ